MPRFKQFIRSGDCAPEPIIYDPAWDRAYFGLQETTILGTVAVHNWVDPNILCLTTQPLDFGITGQVPAVQQPAEHQSDPRD